MKKEYDKKKKLVIFILAAVAVCLAGGLCFYLIRMNTERAGKGACEADHRADGSDCS